jgi:hypothetical protein
VFSHDIVDYHIDCDSFGHVPYPLKDAVYERPSSKKFGIR